LCKLSKKNGEKQMSRLKYQCISCDKKFGRKKNADEHAKHFYHRIEEIIIRKKLTFGEELEIKGLKDEILEQIGKDSNYSSVLITMKLRKIAKISKKEANNAIKELGLDKLGWRPEK